MPLRKNLRRLVRGEVRAESTESGSSQASARLDQAVLLRTPLDLWQRAEDKLCQDSAKAKVYKAYLEILGLDSDSLVTRRLMDARHVLDTKSQELREAQSQLRSSLLKAVKNVLLFKDLINGAANASPIAAIACAGSIALLMVSAFFESK